MVADHADTAGNSGRVSIRINYVDNLRNSGVGFIFALQCAFSGAVPEFKKGFFLEFACSGNCKRPGSAGVPGKTGKFAIIPIPKFKEEPKKGKIP